MTELSQLRLRCRRGMRELDIILNQYLDKSYSNEFAIEETAFKSAFRHLLQLEDPVLYAMLLGYTKPENTAQEAVIKKMREHCLKKENEAS